MAAEAHPDEPSQHHSSAGFYALIYVILMVLLVVTVKAAFLNVDGHWPIIIAFTIAIIKGVLILLYFMHVKGGPQRAVIFALAGFLWLTLLGVMTTVDYSTRGEIGRSPLGSPEFLNPPAVDARLEVSPDSRDHGGSFNTYPVFNKRPLP